MKRFVLSVVVVASFVTYVLYKRINSVSLLESVQNTPEPIVLVTPIPTETPTIPDPAGKYRDGVYTGSVADAFYGDVQVKIVIKGSKITNVIFVQYPHDRQTSITINTRAMPLLKQEAIEAQSAKVDTVTGATATSGAFRESLQDALLKASA